jgi:hypothetical protein
VLRTFTSTTAGETLGFDSLGPAISTATARATSCWRPRRAIRVYLVAGDRTCVADFDRSGRVNGRDATLFLRALIAGDPRADTNCDQRVDLTDYLTYLRAVLLGCG